MSVKCYKFCRRFDMFSYPVGFQVGQDSSKKGKKDFTSGYKSCCGAVLTVLSIILQLLFLAYVIWLMITNGNEEYEQHRIVYQNEEDRLLNLTSVAFMPNYAIHLRNPDQLNDVRDILSLSQEDHKKTLNDQFTSQLALDVEKLTQFVKWVTTIHVTDMEKDLNYVYRVPMVQCKKEWFQGLSVPFVEYRICPDMEKVPVEHWLLSGDQTT